MMWLVLIGLPITLWIISLLVWLLWKRMPPAIDGFTYAGGRLIAGHSR
jgi:hypothetical protein